MTQNSRHQVDRRRSFRCSLAFRVDMSGGWIETLGNLISHSLAMTQRQATKNGVYNCLNLHLEDLNQS
jgi:hypothetical protein